MVARFRSAAIGSAGFTLVEMLVTMAAAIVVLLATFGLVDVSTHVTSRVTDSVDATQRGRTAMERLLQELNSGCVVGDTSPVQASTPAGFTPAIQSDASDIVFVTGLEDGATANLTLHAIVLSGGTLKEYSFANTGGTAPTLQAASGWTFSSTPSPASGTVLLTNVATQPGTPLFQYYSYSNPLNPTSNSLVGALPLATPLNPTWPAVTGENNAALSVAQVDIAWDVGPGSISSDPYRRIAMDDSVVFRLTPANPNTPNYPCD
jgi:Tfp pilus assembly protein PilW